MPKDYASLHVLVIDASGHTRSLVRDVLHSLGFQRQNIREASDGLEALNILPHTQADFVISGWRMEPMDGLTFVRKLRDPEESQYPDLPVILCSRYVDKSLLEQALCVGVNEILVKPINAGGIERSVRSIIERPRPLIQAPDYIGPDRRRVDNGAMPRERRSQKR